MEEKVDDKINPLTAFWREPRASIKYALANYPFWLILLLGSLGTLASLLIEQINSSQATDADNKLSKPNFEKPNLFFELIMSSLSAVIGILIGSLFIAFLYWFFGKILGGKGKFYDLYRGNILLSGVLAPVLPILILWMIISPDTFYGIETTMSGVGTLFTVLVYFVAGLAAVYSIILIIVMLSEVHQFSKWRAFITSILPLTSLILLLLLFFSLVL